MSRLNTVYTRWQQFKEQLPEPDALWHPGEFCHQHDLSRGEPDYRVYKCDYTRVGACNSECHLFNGAEQRGLTDTLEQLINQKEL